VEELVAKIWAEVLKLDECGIHDNFFDLGGHSLNATQVMSRLREAVQADLPLRVLFEAPTVAELASKIEQSISDDAELAEFARSLAEVEGLSEEEIARQLDKENT
jgi:acyl carrier protein